VSAAIEQGEPGSAEENAALIAEHLETAGDLDTAFSWHMRAGTWLTHRDLAAARGSWQRARQVADRLPNTDPDRAANRIAPRTMLCATAWLVGGTKADTGFDELRELAEAADDKVSLAIAMTGRVLALIVHARCDDGSRLAFELTNLLESIGDPTLTLGLLYAAVAAKFEVGEFAETLRLAQRMIDLADGDARKGDLVIGSPLAGAILLRGCARCCLGDERWSADVDNALTLMREVDADRRPTLRAIGLVFTRSVMVTGGVSLPDAATVRESAELLDIAERFGDDFALACTRYAHGLTLMHHAGPQRNDGVAFLAAAREAALEERFTMMTVPIIDAVFAREKIRAGDLDDAIELSRAAVEQQFASGEGLYNAVTTAALVEALLNRAEAADLQEATAAIDRLAALPTEPGFVLHEIWLLRLRALLAQALDDEAAYLDFRDRYRVMATSFGFEGHMKWAENLR
jgi:adenylate cyclase